MNEIVKLLEDIAGTKGVHLEFPENMEHGDYATNVALARAKKEGKNPRDLAEEIVEKLEKDKELGKIVERIEIAGPGFINFFLSKDYLEKELGKIIEKGEKYGSSSLGKDETVVIDYSAPNIAKSFGIGHLRSTIIGQAIYNLYAFLGYKVIGDNHLGDWGTQFGSLLFQIDSKGLDLEKLSLDELEKIYVEFNTKAKEDEKLWDEARKWFKKLEEGDQKAREIWQKTVEISMKEFERIYDLLGVKIDEAYGESFYEDKMPEIVKEMEEKGLVKKSKGAQIVEFKDLPPAMLKKSDGTTTYYTRDLATIDFRIKEWNPKLIVYEVGSEQTLHFKQVFATANKLGWGKGREFIHVAHGQFLFEGKRMSTRKGTTIKLEKLLNEAVKKAKEFNKDEEIAKKVGIGAVKYFDLSHHPTSDIDFRWEASLSLEGNSAPYLQYTVARTNSLLEKAKGSKIEGGELGEEEMIIVRTLTRFPQTIVDSAKNFSPNLVANYLFDLAQKYNRFYNKEKIIGSKNEELRLNITKAVGQVLKNGLHVLGIETPERM